MDDQIKRAFEKWAEGQGWFEPNFDLAHDGAAYYCHFVQTAWIAWEAASKANAELLEAIEWLMEAACEYKLPAHLLSAVKAAGVKVAT